MFVIWLLKYCAPFSPSTFTDAIVINGQQKLLNAHKSEILFKHFQNINTFSSVVNVNIKHRISVLQHTANVPYAWLLTASDWCEAAAA